MAVAEGARLGDLLERQHQPAAVVVRVLERDEPRRRVVRVGPVVHVLLELVEGEQAVARAEAAHLQSGVHSGAAALVEEDVRLLVDEDLVAARGVRVESGLVRHRPRGHVESGLLAEQSGGVLLQSDHRRIIAQHVVADLCSRPSPVASASWVSSPCRCADHRPPHAGC